MNEDFEGRTEDIPHKEDDIDKNEKLIYVNKSSCKKGPFLLNDVSQIPIYNCLLMSLYLHFVQEVNEI